MSTAAVSGLDAAADLPCDAGKDASVSTAAASRFDAAADLPCDAGRDADMEPATGVEATAGAGLAGGHVGAGNHAAGVSDSVAGGPVVEGRHAAGDCDIVAGDCDIVAGDCDIVAGDHAGHVGEGKRAAAGTAPAGDSEVAAGSKLDGGSDVAVGIDADTGTTAAVGSAACRGSRLAPPAMPEVDCCRLVSTTFTAAVAMAAASSCVMEPVKPCRDRLGSDTTASVCATKASKRGPTAATSAAVVSDSGRWGWPLLRPAAAGTTVTAAAAV